MDPRRVYLNMFNAFCNVLKGAQLEDGDNPMWMYGCSLHLVAYSCTDVDYDSDVWKYLDVDITKLAISLKSICNDSLHWHSDKWDQ